VEFEAGIVIELLFPRGGLDLVDVGEDVDDVPYFVGEVLEEVEKTSASVRQSMPNDRIGTLETVVLQPV